ncbi:hypothetical protein ACFPK1_01955 [Actinomycetospora rhizophila]|uniref:Uncharacterized protein n=1 Tax=Actinomycetospora rhizophila TaxID=1416876 RepID=A0ABV9Z6N8_9PSEU
MRLVAVVPHHTIAGGEYDGLAVGRYAGLGFALQVGSSTPSDGGSGVAQEGDPVPVTTVTGTVLLPSDEAPPVLSAGAVQPLLASADETWPADGQLAVTGRLVVEPCLWAADGMLWSLVSDGVRMWSVDAICRIGGDGIEDLATLSGLIELDHGSTYVLELVDV